MKKIGIYAGSFNPYHIGHEDIYKQASNVFDEVIIAQGINIEKEKPNKLFFKDDRQILYYTSLLSDLFKKDEYSLEKYFNTDYYLIRGLRTSFDVGYEDNLRNTLLDFNPDIKVIYFFSHKQFEHISSSMIRSLIPYGKEAYGRYLIWE